MQTARNNRALFAAALCLFMLSVISSTAVGQDQGGKVLPANAKPYGYSLDAMASAMAEFQTSSQFAAYPNTPFQILYCCSGTPTFSAPTCSDGNPGTLEVAGNSFSVSGGTSFFVPLFLFDDTPPVLGVFPPSKSAAKDYIFGSTQFGAEDTKIVVDGKAIAVGPNFLGGPITATPFPGTTIDGVALPPSGGLLDALTPAFCQQLAAGGVSIPGCGNAGSHFLQLGVFLTPMSVGNHTVEIKGQVGNSNLFVQALGPFYGDCLQEHITYTVKVLPPLED